MEYFTEILLHKMLKIIEIYAIEFLGQINFISQALIDRSMILDIFNKIIYIHAEQGWLQYSTISPF